MNRYIHHYLDGLGSSLFSRVPLPIQLPHLWRSFGAPTYRGSNTGKKDIQRNITKPNWVPRKKKEKKNIYIYISETDLDENPSKKLKRSFPQELWLGLSSTAKKPRFCTDNCINKQIGHRENLKEMVTKPPISEN